MYKELVTELRTIGMEIEKYNKNNPRGEQLDDQIVDVIRMMDRMAWKCRKKGLTQMWEEVQESELGFGFPRFDVWKQIMALVVVGAPSELVQEFAVSRYFSMNLHAHDALAVMIYIEFTKHLQMGVDPHLIEELILVLVPQHIEKKYREMAEQEKKSEWYKTMVHDEEDME